MELKEIKNSGESILSEFTSLSEELSLSSTFKKFNLDYLLGTERFFGNLYIPLLADICGIDDEEIIREMGTAYLFGRVFVILQDQLLDNDSDLTSDQKTQYILALPLTLNQMMSGYENIISNQPLYSQIQETLKTVKQFNEQEIAHHQGKLNRFTEDEVMDLGKKTSFFSLPALLYGQKFIGEEKAEKLHSVMDKLIIVIQLCDDLADIEDDLREGNYTHPITEAILSANFEQVSLDAVRTGLLEYGVLNSILETVIGLLQDMQTTVREISKRDAIAEQYFHSLQEYVTSAKEEAGSLNQDTSSKELFTFLQKLKDANLDFPHIYKNYND